jgi:hypothetical protein
VKGANSAWKINAPILTVKQVAVVFLPSKSASVKSAVFSKAKANMKKINTGTICTRVI